jgi:hypothetical protein
MTKPHRQSDARSFLGAALMILSYIGFFGSLLALGNGATSLRELVLLRAGIGLALSSVVLVAASTALHAKSLLWQIPLNCLALSTLVVGIRILITALFTHWQLLLGQIGLLGIAFVSVGATAAWLMKVLQARLLPEQDA